jgi:hypothetical protein
MGRAPLRIVLGKKSNEKGGKYVLSATRHLLDQNNSIDASVFDDLAYLVLHELREIYDRPPEAVDPSVAPFKESAFYEEIRKASYEILASAVPFKESAFYQAMKSDMRGVKYPTSSHYKRAGERMRDLPDYLTDDDFSVEKIIMCLETIGVDADSFKGRQLRERQTSFKKSVGAANQSVEDFMTAGKLSQIDPRQKTAVCIYH